MTRPSVLFVNQHYWPDVAATAQHLTDLAEYLADEGWNVSVLCGRGRYLAGGLEAPKDEVRNGVRIRRISTTAFGRGTLVGRALDYASFHVGALFRGVLGPRYDWVIYLTTPSLLSFVGRVGSVFRRQRYGVWSMDLHPEVEEALGIFRRGRPLTRLLHACARAGDRGAAFVVDLGSCMRERLVARGLDERRLVTIPVWSRKDEIRPIPPEENPLREELGLRDRFVVMYSGNAGLAHRFDEVLEAMRRLKDDPRFFFLFVGDGPRRAEIERFAREHEVPNFRYLDYFPREALAGSLSIGDAHLLTLRDDMAGLAVPSKLYGIMAAGRPVLVVGPTASEPAATVLRFGAGAVVDPEAPGSGGLDHAGTVVEVLREWAGSPRLRRSLGARGRAAFLARFERERGCRSWAELLVALAEVPAEPSDPVPIVFPEPSTRRGQQS